MESLEEWLTRSGRLADRLRAMRARTGKSGKAFAEEQGWAHSKVSRIENGKQLPSRADIDIWVRATESGEEEREQLNLLLQEAHVMRVSWRAQARTDAAVQQDYNRLVEQSYLIRHFETVWVPGLLQVPEYARRIFEELRDLNHPDVDDVEAAVATRMERQRHLYDPGKRFEFLMAEPVLRYLLCPPQVMRIQLDRLLSVVGIDRIRLGIIPLGVVLRWSPVDTFQIYVGERTVTTLETLTGESRVRGEDEELYARLADYLWSQAVSGSDARETILAAIRALPEG